MKDTRQEVIYKEEDELLEDFGFDEADNFTFDSDSDTESDNDEKEDDAKLTKLDENEIDEGAISGQAPVGVSAVSTDTCTTEPPTIVEIVPEKDDLQRGTEQEAEMRDYTSGTQSTTKWGTKVFTG